MENIYIATALLGVVCLYFVFTTRRLKKWQQKLN